MFVGQCIDFSPIKFIIINNYQLIIFSNSGYMEDAVTDKTYTMNEIMAAFAAIQDDLEQNFGAGAGKTERYLIDDVANDVRHVLLGQALREEGVGFERESEDDATLFAGQNYNWFGANGEW